MREPLLTAALATSDPPAPLSAEPRREISAVERGGELPGPLPLFPPDNWWNTDVTDAPVDPDSAAFLSFVGLTRGMHPDFGGDSG